MHSDPNHLSGLTSADVGLDAEKHAFLAALGDRVRAQRAKLGMPRRALAETADVSERHLANLEYGLGNASILVLLQVAKALKCSLTDLIAEPQDLSSEGRLIRDLLAGQDDFSLRRARLKLMEMLGAEGTGMAVGSRIALVGLRGAGKSSLGKMLAAELNFPFVELSREIEKIAGGTIGEIQALYGVSAYRRYEKRAMEEVIRSHSEVVIAAPGGVVADSASFDLMLANCITVWLEATPEDHMNRVIAQGDMRPMAASKEAMEDLKAILAGRAGFYSKARLHLNTSAQDLDASFLLLKNMVRTVLRVPSAE
jgi:XRE family transcriptional regulator, aerobic/anaerobic benzoate catabolism transcriptional regulator